MGVVGGELHCSLSSCNLHNKEGVRTTITVTIIANMGWTVGFPSLGKNVTVVLFLFGDGTIMTTMWVDELFLLKGYAGNVLCNLSRP